MGSYCVSHWPNILKLIKLLLPSHQTLVLAAQTIHFIIVKPFLPQWYHRLRGAIWIIKKHVGDAQTIDQRVYITLHYSSWLYSMTKFGRFQSVLCMMGLNRVFVHHVISKNLTLVHLDLLTNSLVNMGNMVESLAPCTLPCTGNLTYYSP